jgi:hypothetical protein
MSSVDNRPILLVGSVALASAADVFAAAGERLGALAVALPDGETGDRLKWIGWQSDRLRSFESLEVVGEFEVGGNIPQKIASFAPKDGVEISELDFSPLGYAQVARESYAEFKRLKDAGTIAAGTRFQVSLPSPLNIAIFFGQRALDVLPAVERAFVSEVEEIARSVPHQELAIQWDLASETQFEESRRHPERDKLGRGAMAPPLEVAVESAGRVSMAVPADALLGLHLCYGDPDGEHTIQPEDASVMVDFANALFHQIERRIDWVHMPVPIDRTDDAYFAPLDRLELPADTQLYLGLVHLEDGVDGGRARIQAASAHVKGFGVATECGLGRRNPDDIPRLLSLHREIAQL